MNSYRDSLVSIGGNYYYRALRILAPATIRGRRLFHSELPNMPLLFEGGDYSRVASNQRIMTVLLSYFCLSEVDARHSSRLSVFKVSWKISKVARDRYFW